MLDVPVLLIVYRRPELAARALEAIAAARPRRLFVAADGPASEADRPACAAAREAATRVTWPCEVLTDFSERNIGCSARVMSALDWMFEHSDRGIVVEDDCVPAADFFPFCASLLERYRDDTRVMHISGETYQVSGRVEDSYYFSKYALTWGWATWRRAWRLCDRDLATWPELRGRPEWAALFDTREEEQYWTGTFQQCHDKVITTWDYAWWYTCLTQGLSIHPAVNLVTNLGSGPHATHTHGDAQCHRPVGTLPGPLRHPKWTLRNRAADIDTFDRRLVGAVLKRQRTLGHQAGRPGRWARRVLGRAFGR
jgi:hypothetical protein